MWIVVLGFTVLFVLFLLQNPTGREFFVPARTLIAVKLLTIYYIHFDHPPARPLRKRVGAYDRADP